MPLTNLCRDVKDEILLLGSMVEQSVIDATSALKDNDLEQAQEVLENEVTINQKRFEIEQTIMGLIAMHQPAARDLRILIASLNISTELERMGDYAKEIANITLRSQGLSLPVILKHTYLMAESAVDMLHRALTAFAGEDAAAAERIIPEDDLIDEHYANLYQEAMSVVLTDPRNIERINYVIWIAHNLERLGDRVTNICERVIYIVTASRPGPNSIPNEWGISPQGV